MQKDKYPTMSVQKAKTCSNRSAQQGKVMLVRSSQSKISKKGSNSPGGWELS